MQQSYHSSHCTKAEIFTTPVEIKALFLRFHTHNGQSEGCPLDISVNPQGTSGRENLAMTHQPAVRRSEHCIE